MVMRAAPGGKFQVHTDVHTTKILYSGLQLMVVRKIYSCYLSIRRTPRVSRAVFVVGNPQIKKREISFSKVYPSGRFQSTKSQPYFRRTKLPLME